MPWGWAPRLESRAQSHAEPSSTAPWKEHSALVLKRMLASNQGRFNTDGINGPAQAAYLQKQIQAGVREETEADLVHGFRAWLQGTHSENMKERTDTYENKPDGRPHRRKMDGTRYDTPKTDWQSTPWGDAQLTHLPGVREWLREEAIATDKADLEMQLLAEYGPHDIESAWRYYKHWVLKRPISYPHAHAQRSEAGAEAGWHGPGMRGPYNPLGGNPRRSTHFDALPEPPSDRRLAAGQSSLRRPEFPDPPVAQYDSGTPELEAAAALSSISIPPATPFARDEENAARRLPPTPSELARDEAEAANLANRHRIQEQIIQEQIARNQQELAVLEARMDAHPGYRQSIQRHSLSQLPPLPPTPNTPRRSGREAVPPDRLSY